MASGSGSSFVAHRVIQHLSQIVRRPSQRRAQIRTSDVADEQRVTGQNRLRLTRVHVEVEHENRNRFDRVARRLEDRQPHASEIEAVAVGHRRERELGLGLGAEMNPRAGAIAQLEMSGEEVGVEVRQEDVANLQAGLLGIGDVGIDVTLRIDDDGCAARWIADQVRRVREAVQVGTA